MAHRTFNLTLAADSVYRNLYTLLLATTGAVPVDGILVDRVSALSVMSNPDGTVPIYLSDRNSANNAGTPYSAGAGFSIVSNRNSICLRDYYLTGSAELVVVDIESI